MNKLMLWCTAHPGAAAAALLLHAAALASLTQLPTRGERLLAYDYSQPLASLEQSPAAALHPTATAGVTVGHGDAHTRLACLAQRWLHLGGKPTAARVPV